MSFTVDMAIKIVLLMSEPVKYTAENGAKCPLCGQPHAHAYNLVKELERYHKCQTCGLSFKSVASEVIFFRVKGRKQKSNIKPENKAINEPAQLQFSDILDKLIIGEKNNGSK